MQTSTNTEHRSGVRHFLATSRLAIPQGAFETRHQPGHEVSVVDGLMSVSQRGWDVELEVAKRGAGPVVKQ